MQKLFRHPFAQHVLILSLVILMGLAVRLYKINTPLADWHSWRQADTASVTREYVKHNHAFLLPHFHDLSDIPNGLNNVAGYRMVEFPLVNYGIAQILRQFPQLDLVVTSRLVSIVFSLITIAALYSLVWQLTGKKALAVLVASAHALLPYTVFYSRVILPEPALVMTQTLALTFFVAWIKATTAKIRFDWTGSFYVLSLLSFTLALLFKPMAIFIAPVFAVIAFGYLGVSALKRLDLWVYPILSVIPLWWWRHWIAQYPSGIPASSWLFNSNGIRLRPAWWRWLFADRFGRLIFGYWGTAFAFLGLMTQGAKNRITLFDTVTLTWAASMFLYLVVIATGNVQHDYYQVMLTPVFSLLLGRGVWWAATALTKVSSPFVVYPALTLVLGLTFFFAFDEVRGYYNINNPAIVHAGQRIDQIAPADAKVIAPYQGDTAFLFQTNRTGWPIGGRIEEKIGMGAQYYVTTAYDDEAKQLEQKYSLVERTQEFVIIDLTKTK